MNVDTPENQAFIKSWRNYSNYPIRVVNDPMKAQFIGFKMWVQAVQQVGTTDVDAWSDYILESAKLTAVLSYPWVSGKCERLRFGLTKP